MLGEAANQGDEGLAAIVHVIQNRAASGRYPADLKAVALQPLQFSAWNSGAGGNDPVGTYSKTSGEFLHARALAADVLAGRVPDPTYGATHYWAPGGMPGGRDPYWARSEETNGRIKIKDQVFLPRRPVSTSANRNLTEQRAEQTALRNRAPAPPLPLKRPPNAPSGKGPIPPANVPPAPGGMVPSIAEIVGRNYPIRLADGSLHGGASIEARDEAKATVIPHPVTGRPVIIPAPKPLTVPAVVNRETLNAGMKNRGQPARVVVPDVPSSIPTGTALPAARITPPKPKLTRISPIGVMPDFSQLAGFAPKTDPLGVMPKSIDLWDYRVKRTPAQIGEPDWAVANPGMDTPAMIPGPDPLILGGIEKVKRVNQNWDPTKRVMSPIQGDNTFNPDAANGGAWEAKPRPVQKPAKVTTQTIPHQTVVAPPRPPKPAVRQVPPQPFKPVTPKPVISLADRTVGTAGLAAYSGQSGAGLTGAAPDYGQPKTYLSMADWTAGGSRKGDVVIQNGIEQWM